MTTRKDTRPPKDAELRFSFPPILNPHHDQNPGNRSDDTGPHREPCCFLYPLAERVGPRYGTGSPPPSMLWTKGFRSLPRRVGCERGIPPCTVWIILTRAPRTRVAMQTIETPKEFPTLASLPPGTAAPNSPRLWESQIARVVTRGNRAARSTIPVTARPPQWEHHTYEGGNKLPLDV
ncbi:hypothetical protein LX32DRAFT_285972 [Colletotrichum zoysiae]|uniref:Uncharacterized protein n=1 Tax=Colletotrichum zoysiae TaxID=1216348 RepID=A0AAD9H2I2_9PEZI|nr:hypothetical protein LX32DRAFT_285972 [Colletotrichum zoysiae]